MCRLIDNYWLTAEGIMTGINPDDKKSCCCVEVDESYRVLYATPEDKFSDIDNLVVLRGHEIIGYIPKDRLPRPPIHKQIDRSMIQERETLPSWTPIYCVADCLSKSVDTNPYHLLFVTDENRRIIGLLNQADLNRWSCYLYSYLVLLYVEKEACDYIRSACGRKPSILSSMKGLRLSKRAKKAFEEGGMPEKVIRECTTEDLGKMVRHINKRLPDLAKGQKVKEHLDLINKQIGSTKFRNIVAHTVRRIFEKEYTSEDLRGLARIWKEFWQHLRTLTENYLNTSHHPLPDT